MKATGRMISSMGTVKKFGLTILNMKENTSKVKNMERDRTNGQMVVNTKETG